MAYAIAHPIVTAHQGKNRIIDWYSAWNEYRIPVAYDGYASTLIAYCPFCGGKLPRSMERRWYDALYALGYDDPGEQDLPPEYESDSWWRDQ